MQKYIHTRIFSGYLFAKELQKNKQTDKVTLLLGLSERYSDNTITQQDSILHSSELYKHPVAFVLGEREPGGGTEPQEFLVSPTFYMTKNAQFMFRMF